MTDLRHQLRELYDAEAERLAAARESSERDLQTSRVLLGAASFLSLLLVVLVGALLARDMRRREKETAQLDARNRELDRTVQQRTAMLFHLSSSLQKVAEREKAALARELHDELGGLLVATKIDVSWLRKRVDDGSEASQAALGTGAALHGRGPCAQAPRHREPAPDAARQRRPRSRRCAGSWTRRCAARASPARSSTRRSMPELSPDARIAVFRAVQECLMNIVKHAQAKSVLLRVTASDDELSVIVRDDGVGIDEARIETPQSHGLLGMRHRIESLDGTLGIQSLGHGVGTECRFTLPLERIRATGTHQ